MTVTFIATVKNMLLILAHLPKASVKKIPAYLSEVPVPSGYKSERLSFPIIIICRPLVCKPSLIVLNNPTPKETK